MSYNRYDREDYYNQGKITNRRSQNKPVLLIVTISLSVCLTLSIGILIGVWFSLRLSGPTPKSGSEPSNPVSAQSPISGCPSDADANSLFGVPAYRVTSADACAFVLDGGQVTLPVGWSAQWTPAPVDGTQHVAFATTSPLRITISGATVRKTDIYARFSGDPFGDPDHPCRAAEKIVDAENIDVMLLTTVVSTCSGRPEDQRITVLSS